VSEQTGETDVVGDIGIHIKDQVAVEIAYKMLVFENLSVGQCT